MIYNIPELKNFISTEVDYSLVQELRNPFEPTLNPFLAAMFFLSDEKKTVSRSVTTLPDAVSQTGGFMSIFYILMMIMV